MPSVRALACPASLKGVLSAHEAAAALAQGLRSWAEVDELPVSDAFGRPRAARWLVTADGTALLEAAEAIPLDPDRLDPFAASSRGLGELIRAVGKPRELHVGLGGTANVDGGAGLLEVLDELPAPTRVAYDVDVPLLDAARVFAAQKGATQDDALKLEARLLGMEELARFAELPGAGAAGGLGAALASLGAELLPGASLVLGLIGFDPAGYDLVVTGEGTVDRTTTRGKAPGEVARRCVAAGVRCVMFGGRISEAPPGLEVIALSGDPTRARKDLVGLGKLLRKVEAE